MSSQKNNGALKWTILIIALTQMPTLALSPATEQIRSFFNRELAEVQTAMSMTNFVSVAVSVIIALLVNRAVITKKLSVVLGQIFLGLSSIIALLFHSRFWSVYVLSLTIGMATGCFVTSTFGLLFDNFDSDERQRLAGYQTSFINLGGIMMSLIGGLLASFFWYGGYLIFFVDLIVAALCIFSIPSYKTPKPLKNGAPASATRARINPRVYYYTVCIFFFMMLYSACGMNISTHIKNGFANYSSVAGLCNAVQMAGGAFAGIFFGKISARLKDMILFLACLLLFAGYTLLSFFQSSLAPILISVFLAGTSLSLFMPRVTFCVSTYSDPTNSALTTLFISSIAPSMGGFFSPIIITNLTEALSSGSTVFRYRFLALAALALGIAVALATLSRRRTEKA